MGQQQLILLVLATVIVGIAIVIGIRAFTENSIRANSDAMVQDMVRLASDTQAWKQKPAPFGGQPDNTAALALVKADPVDYTGVSLTAIGYPDPDADGDYENLNGTYTVVGAATGVTITGINLLKRNRVVINVVGISDVDIVNDLSLLEVGTL